MKNSISQYLYSFRGWILAALFLLLLASRYFSSAPLQAAGLIPIGLGMVLRFISGRYISNHTNGLKIEAEHFANQGPYRWFKHPLYLSNILIGVGVIFFANCLTPFHQVIFVILVILHHYFLARAEEKFLKSKMNADADFKNTSIEYSWREAWKRQSLNLGKSVLTTVIIWAASFHG